MTSPVRATPAGLLLALAASAFLAPSPSLAFEPEHASPSALIERARSYIEPHGMPAREKDGFALMKKVADEAAGQAAALAQYNVGNLYLNGIGTERSLERALAYLDKAKAAGMPEAALLLARLGY